VTRKRTLLVSLVRLVLRLVDRLGPLLFQYLTHLCSMSPENNKKASLSQQLSFQFYFSFLYTSVT